MIWLACGKTHEVIFHVYEQPKWQNKTIVSVITNHSQPTSKNKKQKVSLRFERAQNNNPRPRENNTI